MIFTPPSSDTVTEEGAGARGADGAGFTVGTAGGARRAAGMGGGWFGDFAAGGADGTYRGAGIGAGLGA